MIGIIELIALISTGAVAYYGHEQFIKDKLDTPRNNEAVKGLDKSEIKAKIKEDEATKKVKEKEIKDKETARKAVLKSDEVDKADQAQELLEAKEELAKEVQELEINLKDLKLVEKGSYLAKVPNKLNLNNGLWVGGSLIGIIAIYKIAVSVLGSIFPSWRQNQ